MGSTVDMAYYCLRINTLHSEIRTNLSYKHPLIPRRLDKRGFTVIIDTYRCVHGSSVHQCRLGGPDEKIRDHFSVTRICDVIETCDRPCDRIGCKSDRGKSSRHDGSDEQGDLGQGN